MDLQSPAFGEGEWLPRSHAIEGDNLSPPLRWSGVPGGAASLLLLMDDPDAPSGTWIHWILFDLPPTQEELPAGLPPSPVVEQAGGARHGRCWGVSRFERIGYQGPAPPPGSPHRYRFRLWALDIRLNREAGADPLDLLRLARSHRLAEAQLTALYASGPSGPSRVGVSL